MTQEEELARLITAEREDHYGPTPSIAIARAIIAAGWRLPTKTETAYEKQIREIGEWYAEYSTR